MAILLSMSAAGYFILTGENETARGATAVVASFAPVKMPPEEKSFGINKTSAPAADVPEPEGEKQVSGQETAIGTAVADPGDKGPVAVDTSAAPLGYKAESKPDETTTEALAGHKAESKPAEPATAAPAAQPVVIKTPTAAVEAPPHTAAPVTYNWGRSASYLFRMEVKVSNNGSETARNVNVSVPLLENSSPYQVTSLKSVNFDLVSSSGRVSTFYLGDIAPGETKTIVADFDIDVRSFSLNSSNETLEQARRIFEQYAGPGNCRDLALAFISECREQGITAREVIGFARTQRGAMTAGSLQGSRHSWAEVKVEGLGWVPVDLTFQYFGAFPHTSHIVESYSDQSVRITHTGGSLSASWSNAVM